MPAATAPVTFIDQRDQRVAAQDIPVPTGSSGWDVRLTCACHDRAYDYSYTHWVQPYRKDADAPLEWLVFHQTSSRVRHFIKSFPSREAAEMWVLHHAE